MLWVWGFLVRMKSKDLFLFSWKKLWIIIIAGFVSIVLHNAISALFNTDEAFFFIIVIFVIPIYFLIMITYSIAYKLMKKQSRTTNKKVQRYSRLMYLGLLMIFPILFFGNQLKGTLWLNFFGVLALIGVGIEISYFIKILKEQRKKKR